MRTRARRQVGMMQDAADQNDASLMLRARAHPSDFAPLYDRYFPRVYAYCLRRTGRPEEAEDAAALIFARALAGLSGYRGSSVAAWLFQIAHNVMANHHRDRRSHDSLDQESGGPALCIQDPTEQRLDRLLRLEERRRLARLVDDLPAEQRELLYLSIAAELPSREVGRIAAAAISNQAPTDCSAR